MNALSGIGKVLALPALGVLMGAGFWFFEESGTATLTRRAGAVPRTTSFAPPVFVGPLPSPSGESPCALALHEGRLLVSYSGSNRIDEFSDEMECVRSVSVPGDSKAHITGLAVDGGRFLLVDHRTGELIMLSYDTGSLLQSYGTFPDSFTRLNLYGLAVVNGTAYASDAGARQVLAISTNEIPGVREEGELLTAFPSPKQPDLELSLPSFVFATPDGRLLVSDIGRGEIRIFSCNGRPVGRFEGPGSFDLRTPMGIAMDDLPSPAFLAVADTVFDPSGMLQQGRVHIVDAASARVHVYDAAGRYVLSYGEELSRPNGITIDTSRRLIFIADAGKHSVMIYTY